MVGATGKVIEPDDHRRLGPLSPLRRFLLGRGREGTFTRYGYPRYLGDVERPRDVEFMKGCFMSARRDAATAVRFDEQLTGYALAEDEDFSYRLSRLGRIRYAPEIVVQHRKLGFGAQDPRRLGRLVVVNRAYLFRKNFPGTALGEGAVRAASWGCSWPTGSRTDSGEAPRASWKGPGTPGVPARGGPSGGADTLGRDKARREGAQN